MQRQRHTRRILNLEEKFRNELIAEFSNDNSILVEFARYFGNAKTAASSHITDIDAEGIEIAYLEKNVDYGLQEKQVRIQWNSPITCKPDAVKQFKSLHIEASSALNSKVDKTYIPPGREQNYSKFIHLEQEEYALIAMYWLLWILIATPSLLPHFVIRTIEAVLGTYSAIYNILFALFCINTSLALAVVYVTMSAEMPMDSVMKYGVATWVCGFMTAGPAIKMAYKQKEKISRSCDIG